MKRLMLLVFTTLALASCAPASSSSSSSGGNNTVFTTEEKAVRERADYWQRADSVSAQYMTGPKAQHQLNMDIAACVAEVRELVRLGSIRKATPPAGVGMDPQMRSGWNSITRDGPLYTEYTEFQDFDGCMKYKGWDRVNYVRPITQRAASSNYVNTILGHTFGWAAPASNTMPDDTQDKNFNR